MNRKSDWIPGTGLLIPLACGIGGLLLIGSEFLNTFVIENLEGEAVEHVGAMDRHYFALGLLGLVGIAAAVTAVLTASRPAAIVVTVAGLAALTLFAAIDLTDAGSTDLVLDPNEDYVEGRVVPAAGFWTSMIGGIILTIGGIILSTLSPTQLRSLAPRRE